MSLAYLQMRKLFPARVAALATALALLPMQAMAAGSNMPWEQPLQQILDSVQGPVAKIIAVDRKSVV